MKPLNAFLSTCVFSAFLCSGASAEISANCQQYTDCDSLVACELYAEVEKALSNMPTDYNGAAARAASYLSKCANYPDKFKHNIDIIVSDNPQVRVTIDWSAVHKRMVGGDHADIASGDTELITYIVNEVFGPDTKAQETFFTDLATKYIVANKADQTARLDDAFVIDFLGTGDNFNKYKTTLFALTGTDKDEQLGIDVTWDDVLVEISNVLDTTMAKRGALVCENNRSWQASIDVVGWGATIAATIATFFAGGAGGAAVTAGRAAIGVGLKTAAQGIAKVGGKAAAKSISKAGGKKLARSAIKLGLKNDMRGYATYKGQGVLKTGTKKYVKTLGQNLKTKKTLIAGAGAAVYQIGGSYAQNSTSATLYGLVESDLTKDYVNCRDLDHNEGCYTVCGDDGAGTDDLNTKALKPVLGKTYCVNEKDYALYEITSNGGRGNPLLMTTEQWNDVKARISSLVKDQGKCDWNEDDIDMYVGYYMYDPDTLEISDSNLIIDDIIRLDD